MKSQLQNTVGVANSVPGLDNTTYSVSSSPSWAGGLESNSTWGFDRRRPRIYGLTTAELTALLNAVREAESIEQLIMTADLNEPDFIKRRRFDALKKCAIDSLESELQTRRDE